MADDATSKLAWDAVWDRNPKTRAALLDLLIEAEPLGVIAIGVLSVTAQEMVERSQGRKQETVGDE